MSAPAAVATVGIAALEEASQELDAGVHCCTVVLVALVPGGGDGSGCGWHCGAGWNCDGDGGGWVSASVIMSIG